MSNPGPILAETALATLRAACKEYFVVQFCLSILIALLGGIWLIAMWVGGVDHLFNSLIAGLFLALGLYATYGIWRMREQVNKRILQLLQTHPEQIVWLYKAELQLLPFGIALLNHARLHIGEINGNMHHIRASARSIDVFIQLYALAYEHITTGHHANNEQLFRTMPALLRRQVTHK